jgi:arylesterase/paraoxonase
MNKFFKWVGGIVLGIIFLAGAVVLRTLVYAGQFTAIDPHFSQSCRTVTGITGGEDLEIDAKTGTLYISAYDRRAVFAGASVSGALYRLDLNDPEAEPIPLWRGESAGDFRPHGISLYRSGDGKQRLFVINHRADGQQLVEVFDLKEGWLTHVESIHDPMFVSPNDLTATGMRSFYLGNDVMNTHPALKVLETMAPLAPSTLLYFDGEKIVRRSGGFIVHQWRRTVARWTAIISDRNDRQEFAHL